MTIDDLKRALVEARNICLDNNNCGDECPLMLSDGDCPFDAHPPACWNVDEWEEDTHETD